MSENELPDVFSLVEVPTIGTIGDDTEIEYGDECPKCETEPPPRIEFLDYSFDTWESAQIVTTYDVYAVTKELRQVLEKADLKGFSFRNMKVSRSEIFADLDPDADISLPEFFEMLINGKALAGPDGWWDYEGECPRCKRPIWKHTDRVDEALQAALKEKAGPPRQVRRESWKGDDIFRLDDPGPPVVTSRFASVLRDVQKEGIVLHPAVWL